MKSPSFALALMLDILTTVPLPWLLIPATAFGLFLAELPFTVFEGELPTLISKEVTSITKSYKNRKKIY